METDLEDQLIKIDLFKEKNALVFKKENGAEYLITKINSRLYLVWGEIFLDDRSEDNLSFLPLDYHGEFYEKYKNLLRQL